MEPIKRANEIMKTIWSISPEKYFDTKFEYQERFFNEKFHGSQIQIDDLSEQNKAEHLALDKKIDDLSEQNKAEHLALDKKIDDLSERNNTEHANLGKRIDRNFQMTFSVLGLIVAMLGLLVALHFIS